MKKRFPLSIPQGMSEFLTRVAEKKGISKNSLIVEIFWEWKRKLNRAELVNMFGESKLIEMEIAVYGEKKKEYTSEKEKTAHHGNDETVSSAIR